MAFHPSGTCLATASLDGKAKIWDPGSGEELLTLQGHTSVVTSIAYNPTGTRVATSS